MTGSLSWEPSLAGQSEDWGVRSGPMVYCKPYSRPYNYIESSGESSLSNASCPLPLPSRCAFIRRSVARRTQNQEVKWAALSGEAGHKIHGLQKTDNDNMTKKKKGPDKTQQMII